MLAMTLRDRSPFDPSLEDMRAMGNQAVELVAGFVEERYSARSSDYESLEPMLASLAGPPPAEGGALGELLDVIRKAAGKGFDTANPGFLAYIPGGGLYASALADFIACGVNRYTGLAAPAPALVQMEASVLRWLCDLFGLPPGSQGVLTPGGSMSNLSAVITARSNVLGERFLEGTMYVSQEVHHSISKSARIAGLPSGAVRSIPADDELRFDVAALKKAIAKDRAADKKPFMIVGSAGTVNTGVVDPLEELAELAAEEGLWFHVDGAYGGFFQLTERGRERLRGIERADSITLDPHKGLFLPYGTGCLLARDGAKLRAAHEGHADYLPALSDDPSLPDLSSFTPELTRDFRGLRLWLPLHLHGVDAFVAALDEKLDLANFVYDELKGEGDLQLPWSPHLSLVAFRPTADSGIDPAELLARINSDGRLWLSSAPVRGDTFLRVCILSHRSHPMRMKEGVDVIRSAISDLKGAA
jgi:aromatic-L-amino-acid decarboxylase